MQGLLLLLLFNKQENTVLINLLFREVTVQANAATRLPTTSISIIIMIILRDWNEIHRRFAFDIFADHLRLVSGSSPCAGRVEVYHDGQWGTVYGSGWDLKAAAVVCKELGCGAALSAPGDAHFGEGTSPKLTYNAQCKGNESALRDCESDRGEDSPWGHYSWSYSSDAGVICSDYLRLVNGGRPCAGRVEVYHDGQWGTVDGSGSGDSAWDMLDAAVVCKELGCGAALSASGDAHFGEGSGPVVTRSVRCRGSESTLRDCQSYPWSDSSWLSHSYDAGVICSGKYFSLPSIFQSSYFRTSPGTPPPARGQPQLNGPRHVT
uniref:SRCR domain-containing protein n=1 Tax=Callorhinchus milii TaxID=7868 RepID=A0A4W3GFS6_CALMI